MTFFIIHRVEALVAEVQAECSSLEWLHGKSLLQARYFDMEHAIEITRKSGLSKKAQAALAAARALDRGSHAPASPVNNGSDHAVSQHSAGEHNNDGHGPDAHAPASQANNGSDHVVSQHSAGEHDKQEDGKNETPVKTPPRHDGSNTPPATAPQRKRITRSSTTSATAPATDPQVRKRVKSKTTAKARAQKRKREDDDDDDEDDVVKRVDDSSLSDSEVEVTEVDGQPVDKRRKKDTLKRAQAEVDEAQPPVPPQANGEDALERNVDSALRMMYVVQALNPAQTWNWWNLFCACVYAVHQSPSECMYLSMMAVINQIAAGNPSAAQLVDEATADEGGIHRYVECAKKVYSRDFPHATSAPAVRVFVEKETVVFVNILSFCRQ